MILDPEDEDDEITDKEEDTNGIGGIPDEDDYDYLKEKMKSKHPGYSDESYNAGMFLGTDFPYVAGDPGL